MPSKKEIINILKEKKYDELVKLSPREGTIINTLISLSYDKKSLISWRAIEAIGLITREISKSNPELVRNIVGRLLWMIRDESGGIGWSAPEILGEIVRNNPDQTLRGYAAWALGEIGASKAVHELEKLKNDNNLITFYEEGELKEKAVGEVAAKAIAKLKS